MAKLELFGTAGCGYTEEMRNWLELRGADFVEHDIDADVAARARLSSLVPDLRIVPVLVDDDVVVEVGWRGRGCFVGGR